MNPLIGSTPDETMANASEALNALMCLLSKDTQHSGIVFLLMPIASALEANS